MESLPNDLIMRIIREADGGRFTHAMKMKEVFQVIEGVRPMYYYEDGCGNQCPQYVYEDFMLIYEEDLESSDEEEDN